MRNTMESQRPVDIMSDRSLRSLYGLTVYLSELHRSGHPMDRATGQLVALMMQGEAAMLLDRGYSDWQISVALWAMRCRHQRINGWRRHRSYIRLMIDFGHERAKATIRVAGLRVVGRVREAGLALSCAWYALLCALFPPAIDRYLSDPGAGDGDA